LSYGLPGTNGMVGLTDENTGRSATVVKEEIHEFYV
jgi:hypothetical protein